MFRRLAVVWLTATEPPHRPHRSDTRRPRSRSLTELREAPRERIRPPIPRCRIHKGKDRSSMEHCCRASESSSRSHHWASPLRTPIDNSPSRSGTVACLSLLILQGVIPSSPGSIPPVHRASVSLMASARRATILRQAIRTYGSHSRPSGALWMFGVGAADCDGSRETLVTPTRGWQPGFRALTSGDAHPGADLGVPCGRDRLARAAASRRNPHDPIGSKPMA